MKKQICVKSSTYCALRNQFRLINNAKRKNAEGAYHVAKKNLQYYLNALIHEEIISEHVNLTDEAGFYDISLFVIKEDLV